MNLDLNKTETSLETDSTLELEEMSESDLEQIVGGDINTYLDAQGNLDARYLNFSTETKLPSRYSIDISELFDEFNKANKLSSEVSIE